MPSSGRFRGPLERDWIRKQNEYDRRDREAQTERDRLAATEQQPFAHVDNTMQATPMAMMAAAAPGTMGNPAESVTPVDIPRAIFTHPFQDTVTVSLPYQMYTFNASVTLASVRAASDVYQATFRLNSPVDVQTSYTYVADPTPTADSVSAPVNSPMYWNYYSKLYRYYTVIKSKYKIVIRPRTVGGRYLSAWTYHHGNQGPPIMDASFVYPTDHYKAFHPHARCTPLAERMTATAHETTETVARTITGEYYPGRISVQNDVVEDELTRTWHKCSDVPPLKELCTLLIHKADFQENSSTSSNFDISFEITYHVQFKDLYEQFAYPYLGTAFPTISNYADQTLWLRNHD